MVRAPVATKRSMAARWDELTEDGAAFDLHPSIWPADFMHEIDDVLAAENHLVLRRGRMGMAFVVEKERQVCSFGGANTLARIIGTRYSRVERGHALRLRLARERREAEAAKRAAEGPFGAEFEEDVRVANRRNTLEAARVFLARINANGSVPVARSED